MNEYDVVIVGAGTSGAIAARFAALNGLKVCLIDALKKQEIPNISELMVNRTIKLTVKLLKKIDNLFIGASFKAKVVLLFCEFE